MSGTHCYLCALDAPTPPPGKKRSNHDVLYHYPSAWSLRMLMLGLCFAVFLLSADRTIVSTAIPYISNEFHAYSDVGWYGSSYLLTSSALQPMFGRLYQFYQLKWTYLVALTIFLVGSIVSATASTSVAFIIGRAITGVGSAGILSGSFVAVAHSVPLQKRPLYTAGLGAVYALGSIAGPLLGGVFTSEVTWRWCFWLNLPVGGFTVFAMLLLFPRKEQYEESELTLSDKLSKLDMVGTVLLLGSAVMFFLALEDVNNGLPWSSATVAGLLAGALATIIVFTAWQFWQQENALIPPSISTQRTVAFACASSFFLYSALLVHIYYLSIWFQAIQGRSALLTGVDLLPYIITSAVATIVAGVITSKSGYFAPPAWVGCALATLGAGLLVTLRVNEQTGKWVGFFIICGAGFGFAVQQSFTGVQAVLSPSQIPIGTAAITFFQTLGGAVFVSVGNTILLEELKQADIPNVDISKVISAGATMFKHLVPPASRAPLLSAYNSALRDVFVTGTVLAGLACLTSLGMELRSIKDKTAPEQRGHHDDGKTSVDIEVNSVSSDNVSSDNMSSRSIISHDMFDCP